MDASLQVTIQNGNAILVTTGGGLPMSTRTVDAKSKSASEAFANSFGSYPIGYALGIIILPLSAGWIQEDPYTVNIFITLIYATVSFARTYFLRRVFEKFGIEDNFIRLGVMAFGKITEAIQKNPRGGKTA